MWLFTGIAHREWAQTVLARLLPLEARVAQLAFELQRREREGHETGAVHRELRELSRHGTLVQGLRPEIDARLAEAERWVRRALEGDRLQAVMAAKAWENLGAIAGLRDPGAPAVREYSERAVQIEPRQFHAHFNLGVYWQNHGDREAAAGREWQPSIDRALAAYERAMESADTALSAVLSWLTLRRRVRPIPPDSDELVQFLERWERLCDRFPTALPLRWMLTRELAQVHRHDALERNARRALEWDPTWAEGWRSWVDAVAETRPDGKPGNPELALQIADEARRYLTPAAFAEIGLEQRVKGLTAGVRQRQLWAEKASRPRDYGLFRDIGLNALDIPDLAVAREHLAQARTLDPVRFADEGHEDRLRELQQAHRRETEDERLREHGEPASLWFRAQQAFAQADLTAAWTWIDVLVRRDAAAVEAAGQRALATRVRAALDLAELGSPAELITNAHRAATEHRWPEVVFYWRRVRERDAAAFREAGGPAALAAAEESLQAR
jgi:hypothetical protein